MKYFLSWILIKHGRENTFQLEILGLKIKKINLTYMYVVQKQISPYKSVNCKAKLQKAGVNEKIKMAKHVAWNTAVEDRELP